MSSKVLISVKTLQVIEGEPEEIELITEGEYFKEGNDYIAVYDETEISGMEGTRTTLRIENDTLSILRNGTTNSNLIFKQGIEHISLYSTPYGAIEVKVNPNKVNINVDDKGGRVELQYRMETLGFEPIKNSLELNIKPIN